MEASDTLTLGMFVTLAALIVGSIWNQHREANAMRAENTRQIERLGDQFAKRLDGLTKRLDGLGEALSGVRERLARIEGHLRLEPPPRDEEPTEHSPDG